MNTKILISTILPSLLASLLAIFLLHFFGKWEKEKDPIPGNYISKGTQKLINFEYSIDSWTNTCALIHRTHSTIVRNGDKVDITRPISNIKISKSFEFSFYEHFPLTILLSIPFLFIFYRIFNKHS